jgi:hypothetical protein
LIQVSSPLATFGRLKDLCIGLYGTKQYLHVLNDYLIGSKQIEEELMADDVTKEHLEKLITFSFSESRVETTPEGSARDTTPEKTSAASRFSETPSETDGRSTRAKQRDRSKTPAAASSSTKRDRSKTPAAASSSKRSDTLVNFTFPEDLHSLYYSTSEFNHIF